MGLLLNHCFLGQGISKTVVYISLSLSLSISLSLYLSLYLSLALSISLSLSLSFSLSLCLEVLKNVLITRPSRKQIQATTNAGCCLLAQGPFLEAKTSSAKMASGIQGF